MQRNTLPHTSDTREPDNNQGQTEISRTQGTDPCQCMQARHNRQRGSQQGTLSQTGQHPTWRNHSSQSAAELNVPTSYSTVEYRCALTALETKPQTRASPIRRQVVLIMEYYTQTN